MLKKALSPQINSVPVNRMLLKMRSKHRPYLKDILHKKLDKHSAPSLGMTISISLLTMKLIEMVWLNNAVSKHKLILKKNLKRERKKSSIGRIWLSGASNKKRTNTTSGMLPRIRLSQFHQRSEIRGLHTKDSLITTPKTIETISRSHLMAVQGRRGRAKSWLKMPINEQETTKSSQAKILHTQLSMTTMEVETRMISVYSRL